MTKKLLLFFTGLIAFVQLASAEVYQVDSVHSQVHFTVTHLMFFKVRGVFKEFSGTIEADPQSKTVTAIRGTVQVSSIDTREAKRDGHLRSPDFFDGGKFPQLTFISKEITGKGDNIMVHGDLSIRGITKRVSLKGKFLGSNKDPWGVMRVGFEGETTISRKDFGLTWNKALETGGVMVGDNVKISLEIQGIKQT